MKIMNRPLLALLTLSMGLSMALGFATTSKAQSLAELARQERARKGQTAKTGKTYTNEDIPAAAMSGTPAAAQPAAEVNTGEAAPAGDKAAAAQEKTPAELEKDYRDRFAKLTEAQKLEETKLDVMQRELNLMQIQVSSDPNVQLREDLNREAINKRTADIEAQKTAVEKAKQAIADLEEELRKKSLPPGWAR